MTKRTPGAALPPAEQAELRDLLAEQRESVTAQIETLTRDLEGIIEAANGIATDDEHDPEGATIAFERSHVSALLDQSRAHLDDLDLARERLDEGTYGICEQCGNPIAAERLAARPVARTCITCAARSVRQ